MFSKSLTQIVLGLLLLAAVPAAVQAACPSGIAVLDLKTLNAYSNLGSFVSFNPGGNPLPVPATAACPAAAGWKMAVLKIVVPGAPNTCTQANIVVEYEGLPSAWTVNLGDSPTNDGYAGDGGTTDNDAELWVLGEDLSLANGGTLAQVNNPLAMQHLSLTNGSLKFLVKNQFVSWGQPYSVVQSPASKFLFAIPDTTVPAADQRAIYLGLNRVIAGTHRTGCGARRVLVSFQ
ncbi:MAG TPA: hypothetical protein VGX68_19135 [Thermoanaerobaculia bacterium]|jgi:hypothetical protein|nr:hypothetical protein [Thermoanaerobaculia bacterium]